MRFGRGAGIRSWSAVYRAAGQPSSGGQPPGGYATLRAMSRRPPAAATAPAQSLADLQETFPTSELTVRDGRCVEDDEDLLFLFLSEREVFLKLTRHCNNRCRFCCDTVFWNGSNMAPERVRAKIAEGAERGLRSLFLSGGEPTIHPQFVEFIRYGSELGYTEIITITNGRMFCYPEFAAQCVEAGLTLAVVSCNSHDAKTHDSLVSVKGAFGQVRRGLRNLRRLGCPFNMSAVVNRQNLHQLPQMVRAFLRWGAGAVTFMQLIPNDRDWARSRRTIYYDLAEGRRPVRAALETARELRFPLELKKFPDPFLEDFEEQIPEPFTWALELTEIDWRRPERFAPFRSGAPILCYGERCRHCAYESFCAYLMNHQSRRREGRFDGFELTLDGASADGGSPDGNPLDEAVVEGLARQPEAVLRLKAPDLAAAQPWIEAAGHRPLVVQLARTDGVAALADEITVVVEDDVGLEAMRDAERSVEVVLNVLTARWLREHTGWVREKGSRLTLVPQFFLRLETAQRGQVDLPAALEPLPLQAARLRAMPPCLSGREDSGRLPHLVTLPLLATPEDIPAHARHYYWRRYLTKSHRCGGCRLDARCDGAHINYVRQFGYRALKPLG